MLLVRGLLKLDTFGDVRGVLDDLAGLAVQVEDRVVGRLQPDLPAALAEPHELAEDPN